ncbi:MAG: alpha/beta fold hydrolase [Gammaproteobacteria bacterium]|nr:alpha/beta fold hydrolase [Gammaproteobacteria bacterium]
MKLTVNDTTIHCDIRGDGEPLLMMHGGLGLDHAYLRPFFERLGGHRQIYYDHRGSGHSDAPDDWSKVTFDTFTADANALREQLAGGRAAVFGHSYGGFIAQKYALAHGETLRGLVLCATASNLADYPPVMPGSTTPEQQAAFGEIFSASMKDDASWRRLWATALPMYFHDGENKTTAAAMKAMEAATTFRAAAWNHSFGLLAEYSVKDRLGEIRAPALILAGRHDFVLPPAYAEDLHRALPNSELVMFENSGHFPFIEEPDKFIDALGNWLSKLP